MLYTEDLYMHGIIQISVAGVTTSPSMILLPVVMMVRLAPNSEIS